MQIRSDGTWVPVGYPPGCSSSTVDAAVLLAGVLERMGGPAPVITEGPVGPAIVVGLVDELAPPGWVGWLQPPELSGDAGAVVLGGSLWVWARSSEHLVAACWKVLELLGYAYLRPHADWERVPQLGGSVEWLGDVSWEFPLFVVPPGFDGGLMAAQVPILTDWAIRQGIPAGWDRWQYGHIWNAIANGAGLAQDGVLVSTKGQKLACTSIEVVQAAVDHALDALDDPDLLGVSMSASDGSAGWTEPLVTGEGTALAPSARQQALAYDVQLALASDGLNVRVVTMAYGDTTYPALPAGTPVSDRQVVLVVTAYRKGGRTVEQIGADYPAATVGNYEQDAWQWGYERPGYGVYGSFAELVELDARRFDGGPAVLAGCDTWGARGRGFWAVAGEDPLERWVNYPSIAFPSAVEEAEAVCELLDTPALVTSDLLHRLGLATQELLAATADSPLEYRCAQDIARHVVAMHLLRAYDLAPSGATLEPWLVWASRCWNEGRWVEPMRLPYYDGAWAAARAEIAAKYSVAVLSPGPNLPWPMPPIETAELDAALANVIATEAPLPWTPRTWDYTDLVLGTSWAGDTRNFGAFGSYSKNPVVVWIASATSVLQLTAKGCCGQNAIGDCWVRVYDDLGVLVNEQIAPLVEGPLAPITVEPLRVYRLEYGQAQGTKVTWPTTGIWAVHELRETATAWYVASGTLYFYVADEQPIGVYTPVGGGTVASPDGATVYTLANGYNLLAVPAGQTGWWRIRNVSGLTWLGTQPALVARHPREGMLPRSLGVS